MNTLKPLSAKRRTEMLDAFRRRKKYLIVQPDGTVLYGKDLTSRSVVEKKAHDVDGIILIYTDTLPQGLQRWKADIINGITGAVEQSVRSPITAKSLGNWWRNDGIKLLYPGELKGKKVKFYQFDLFNRDSAEMHYKYSDPAVTFAFSATAETAA